jgi:hypothetical protein
MNKRMLTLAAAATLVLGGVAFAQNTASPAAGSNANAMS